MFWQEEVVDAATYLDGSRSKTGPDLRGVEARVLQMVGGGYVGEDVEAVEEDEDYGGMVQGEGVGNVNGREGEDRGEEWRFGRGRGREGNGMVGWRSWGIGVEVVLAMKTAAPGGEGAEEGLGCFVCCDWKDWQSVG